MGYVIKLIGYTKSEKGKILCRVSPMLIPFDSPLSSVEDVFNAIMVRGDSIGDVMFYGRGAGKLPTASAVMADVIDIVKGSKNKNYIWTDEGPDILACYKDAVCQLFVRMQSATQDDIRKVFPDAVFAPSEPGAFITPEDTERSLLAQLEKINGQVKHFIRVMS